MSRIKTLTYVGKVGTPSVLKLVAPVFLISLLVSTKPANATVRILGPREESSLPEELRRAPMQRLSAPPTATGAVSLQPNSSSAKFETQAEPILPASSASGRKRVGPTQKNDTLWKIASRNTPKGMSIYQVIGAIFRLNPQAFAEDNIHLLEPGSILLIPTRDEIKKEKVQAVSARLDQDQPAATRYQAANNRRGKNEKGEVKKGSRAKMPGNPAEMSPAEVNVASKPAASVAVTPKQSDPLQQVATDAVSDKQKVEMANPSQENAPQVTDPVPVIAEAEQIFVLDQVDANVANTAQNAPSENGSAPVQNSNLSGETAPLSEGESAPLIVSNTNLQPEKAQSLAPGLALSLARKEHKQLLLQLEQMLESDHRLKVRLAELQNQVDELIQSNVQQKEFNQTLQGELEQRKKADEQKLAQKSPSVFDYLVEKPWLLALGAILPALLFALLILLLIRRTENDEQAPASERVKAAALPQDLLSDSDVIKLDPDSTSNMAVADDQKDELMEFDVLLEDLVDAEDDEKAAKNAEKKAVPEVPEADIDPDAPPVVIVEPPQSLESSAQPLSAEQIDEPDPARSVFSKSAQDIDFEDDEIDDRLMRKPSLSAKKPEQEPPAAPDEDKTEPRFAQGGADLTPDFDFELDDDEFSKQLDRELAELMDLVEPAESAVKEDGSPPLTLDANNENLQAEPAASAPAVKSQQKPVPEFKLDIEDDSDLEIGMMFEAEAEAELAIELEQQDQAEPQDDSDAKPKLEAPSEAELTAELESEFEAESKLERAPELETEPAIEPPTQENLPQDTAPQEKPQQNDLPLSGANKNRKVSSGKKTLSKEILSQLNPGQALESFDNDAMQVAGLDMATLWDDGEQEMQAALAKPEPPFEINHEAYADPHNILPPQAEPEAEPQSVAPKPKKLAVRKPRKQSAKPRPIEPTWLAEEESAPVEKTAQDKPLAEEEPQEELELSDAPFISLKALLNGDNDDEQLEKLAMDTKFDKYEKLLAEISPVDIDFAGSDESKLALAKAYIEMKDFDGARQLLESLLNNEDDALQSQANDIYIKLPKKQ